MAEELASALNLSTLPKPYQDLYKIQSKVSKDLSEAETSIEKFKLTREADAVTQQKKAYDEASDKYQEKTKKEQEKLDSFGDVKFQPTQDNIQDIAGLFSAVGIIGAMIGGSGRNSAMNALSSMTGMLDGWKQGRADLFKKEKINFDANLNKIKLEKDAIRDKMNAIAKEMVVDKEKADMNYKVLLAQYPDSVFKKMGEIGGFKASLDFVNGAMTKATDSLVSHNYRMTEESVKQANRVAIKNMELANQKAKDSLKAGDLPSFIREQTGANLNAKDANEVGQAALSVGHAYSLMGKVQEHPEWVGRSGQIKQFFNRYVDSLNSGKPLPPDDPKLLADKSGQEALVFAKDYAAYLVNYERALAGGARGFTVQFQKRFNALLDQNQFNPTGFQNLMKQQIDEISNNAAVKSPGRINKDNITNMGLIIYEKDPDAIRGYQSTRPSTQTTTKPTPTQADRDLAKKSPELRKKFKEHFGVEP
jgi:hypothetical protein